MSLIDIAKTLIDKKLYGEAEQICYEVIGKDPYSTTDWAHAWHLVGIMANQHGKHEVAEEALNKAIQLFPIHPGFYINLGNTLHRQKKLDLAELAFQKAIRLDPRIPEGHFALGNCFFLQSKYEDAIDAYLECIKLSPEHDKVWINLGSAYKDMGLRDRSWWAYDQYLMRHPDDHGVMVRRALTFSPVWQTAEQAEREFYESMNQLIEINKIENLQTGNAYLDIGSVPFYDAYTGLDTLEFHQILNDVLAKMLPKDDF